MNKKYLLFLIILFAYVNNIFGQQYKSWNSSQILNELQKINVCANVLYIAAHPDDENTRLLTYLANERKYRTGYLSLTRGDGGQNLIGNEQGIDLGLIRTQELLAARSIDGAEQFFSTAFDFGFSKTSEETFNIWNKEKILSDVVWIIRKFKPEVIIARFPEDTRAGHGHHAASGILAREAFYAAADASKFPEQLKLGVQVWQAKRLLWNTFNFGTTNTTSENQLKIDVGQYNALLGKSYGEIAALSRSQHKSQGFGVPSQRGSQLEYFTTIAGDTAKNDILDGINTTWTKAIKYKNIGLGKKEIDTNSEAEIINIDSLIKVAINNFDIINTEKNIPNLVQLFTKIKNANGNIDKAYYLEKLQNIILQCAGLYAEATTSNAFAYPNDSLKINFSINARLQDGILLKNIFYKNDKFNISQVLLKNKNFINFRDFFLPNNTKLTQPYWLQEPMEKGRFTVNNQQLIGNPNVDYEKVQMVFELLGELFFVDRTIQYKYTDPVKAEIFQPLYIVPNIDIAISNKVVINTAQIKNDYAVTVTPRKSFKQDIYSIIGNTIVDTLYRDGIIKDSLKVNEAKTVLVKTHSYNTPAFSAPINYSLDTKTRIANKHLTTIQYDHIPTIAYTSDASVKLLYNNIIAGTKKIGYINGAGDKVVDALLQLGYTVDILQQKDVNFNNIKKYDAVITGVRCYNTNEWMNAVYDQLMLYINNGGNLIVQYNTSNQIGPIKAKIAPYSFNISRNRITDENAIVTFINPNEPLLNTPNKITNSDFENWIQERSIYEATEIDTIYRKVFVMNDKNEKSQNGSLIVAPYGKGNFIYCSLVLFRELPAGIAGAYKLIANMVALKQNKNGK